MLYYYYRILVGFFLCPYYFFRISGNYSSHWKVQDSKHTIILANSTPEDAK